MDRKLLDVTHVQLSSLPVVVFSWKTSGALKIHTHVKKHDDDIVA